MRRSVLILSIFLIIAVNAVFAQSILDLRIGSTVSGNLNSDQIIWYRVRAAQDCILIVETLGSVDTYLDVCDNQQNVLFSNDDQPNDNNAKIEMLAIAGETYLFKLRGYSSEDTGPFRISASQKSIPRTPDLPVTVITLQTRNGNIERGGEYWFTVKPSTVGMLVVETSGDTDTYLTAYSENGFIMENDDGGLGGNARISIDVKKPGVVYLFKLTGYDSDVRGPYSISATLSVRN